MSSELSGIKDSLVDKILEQGQRLRNAMVQSILQNDPLTSDICNKTHNTPASSAASLTDNFSGKKLLEAFLNGDYLTKEEEQMALNTVRSLPVEDVYCATEKTGLSKCKCSVCSAYHPTNLKCDLRRAQHHNGLKKQNGGIPVNALKQVDSLRIVVQSIHLNSAGSKKVSQGTRQADSRLNETYFVEYCVPEVFTKGLVRSKSKTDSGLESAHVRICARRTSNVIHVHQTFTHSISNLYNCNLDDHDLTFIVRFKNSAKKKAQQLGVAKFNFGVFRNSQSASSGKTLPVFLDEESTISVGTIKVTVQLGVGKLYFGQEFIDAVLGRNSPLESNSSEERLDCKEKHTNVKLAIKKASPVVQPVVPDFACFEQRKAKTEEVKSQSTADKAVQLEYQLAEAELLFGFLYISEAHFLKISRNSFILCKPYCQNDTSSSGVVYGSAKPLYNFCQTIPLLYEESLLLKLRENFMLIEFWEKTGQSEELFGLTRLPLHQFYLAYRNAVILKHLKRNKLPVIGTDWWEPIYSIDKNELIGQVQVLTALGTEDQIKNLELERGFRDDIVRAKFPKAALPKSVNQFKQPASYFSDKAKVNRKPVENQKTSSSTEHPEPIEKPKQCHVGVQSNMEGVNLKSGSSDFNQAQEMLLSFIKFVEQNQRPPCVENSTNTENAAVTEKSPELQKVVEQTPMPQLCKTSDLLDSLQTALSPRPPLKAKKPAHFEAEVRISSANQLPRRRKIKNKTKRAKGNTLKQENLLPSTYVTFETLPGEPLQMTCLCPKTSTPIWDFRCRVNLPMDLVTNDKKRLIFKVWKNATSSVLQPNMQTDTVLGFAALDLSVLSMGMDNVQGWFNIIDFSGNCNGQINIKVFPLENIQKILNRDLQSNNNIKPEPALGPEEEDCNELFGRALKRKFTQLDEITQRLRLRLSEVVSDDSEGLSDDATDEFEHDINNLCVEEDFDMVNFDDKGNHKVDMEIDPEANRRNELTGPDVSSYKLDSNYSGLLSEKESETSSESTTCKSAFSENLMEGKQRIDNLLEKLTLITSDATLPVSQRYVSGCSAPSDANDIQNIFKDLEQHSRPNITSTNSFDPTMFQQLYGSSLSNTSLLKLAQLSSVDAGSDGSETSVITNFSDFRPKPDGQDPTIG